MGVAGVVVLRTNEVNSHPLFKIEFFYKLVRVP